MVVAIAIDDMLFISLYIGYNIARIKNDCSIKMSLDKNTSPALFIVLSIDALFHDDPIQDFNKLYSAIVVAANAKSPIVVFKEVQYTSIAVFDDA